MKREADGIRTYSPTDLVRFLRSPFVAEMDRIEKETPGRFPRDPERDEEKVVAEIGNRHEAVYTASVRAAGKKVVEVARGAGAREETARALRAGTEVVAQGALALGPLFGYADYLERVPGESLLGDFHYEVADTKLAAAAKPGHLLQLCAYAEMLEALQGRRPERVHVVVRDGSRRTFRTDDHFFAYLRVKRAFLEAMAKRPDPDAFPDAGGDWAPWSDEARRRLERVDHLSLVANIRGDQVRKLGAAGVRTREDLARRCPARVKGVRDETLARLSAQARLQSDSRAGKALRWERVEPDPEHPRRGLALLPPPSPLDVYFDMEGYPFAPGGLEYLFGAVAEGEKRPEYLDWWAHDEAGEREAFRSFVEWVAERRARDPSMHVYHYAPYERTACRRLMGRHAVCEAEVDDFLRGGVFVDLYAVVRQGVRVGAPSYSIKDLEALYGRKRGTEVRSGGDSIAAYHRWIESGEARDPAASKRLAAIRDYNRDDCESTRDLALWLRERQQEARIPYVPEREPEEPEDGRDATPSPTPSPRAERRAAQRALAAEMLASIPAEPSARASDPDRWRITELLAHLVEFHRREDKPVWWSLFDRNEMDDDQHCEDANCLGGLVLESAEPVPLKKSKGWWYRFPAQETKVSRGSDCCLAGTRIECRVEEMDEEAGRVLVKFGPSRLERLEGGRPPAQTALILHSVVPAGVIEDSIERTATAWTRTGSIGPLLRALLLRLPPKVEGHRGGPLVGAGEEAVAATVRLVHGLRDSVLCIQGPPGTGKTFTAAAAIASLVGAGRRVGVASNSHEAIRNVLRASAVRMGRAFACLKAYGSDREADQALAAEIPGIECVGNADVAARLADHRLVAGTAWTFSREDLVERFDVLFVDEAGQVSLANLVGMAPCAKSVVLLGDPMQLPQPTQGVHPGDSGASALDHALGGKETVPEDFGVFLPVSRRLHPSLCEFVGGAFYEGRLRSLVGCEKRVLRRRGEGADPEAGLLFVPVPHEGSTQKSDEEVATIARIVDALMGREATGLDGRVVRPLGLADVLIVAPYNLQVRALRSRLPAGARVGTVDKFQGQEACVSIVSLTASDPDLAPRGLEFVLDRRRLNVAVSRAQSLSIVVGSPALALARCRTVEHMRLVNTLCRMLGASAAKQ